jgi:gas vesicle protein
VGSGTDEQVEELRRQADETRENLGEAVGALAYKGDVKNRGKEIVADKKEALMEKVGEVKDRLPDKDAVKDKLPDKDAVKEKLPDGAPSAGDVKAKAHDAAATAGEHPVALAAGAAAAGLAAGLAIPETKIEREKLAPPVQDARRQAQDRAQEVVQQVKEGAQDAAGSTIDAVREQAQQHDGKVGELAETAADKADEHVR